MLDELLPDREANDSIFRLAWAVLQSLESGPIWLPITYFDLWMLRLMGFLPAARRTASSVASRSPASLPGSTPCATASSAPHHRRIASSEMSSESRELAARIFRNPVDHFTGEPCPASRLADLRKFLMQILARHLDRKLQTSAQLERLD